MIIDHDQYKIIICDITEDECNNSDCIRCEIAIANTVQENQTELEQHEYTIFIRDIVLHGVGIVVNSANVIAKATKEDILKLQEKNGVSKTVVEFSEENIVQYYEQYLNLRKYNNFGIPDRICTDKNKPGVFQWGELYFLIAPRIESE